jgi:hypothetical protein
MLKFTSSGPCHSVYPNTILNRIFLLLLHFLLGPTACSTSELIRNYRSCRQLVGFLGRVISPVARLLLTQENTNTEETRTDFHASSGIRTHDPSVRAGEDISCLYLPNIFCLHSNVLLSSMFSNIFNLSSFRGVRDHVSHPNEPTGKSVTLYISM